MFRFILLALVWLAWSGHYTLHEPLIAAFGVGSCALVVWISHRMRKATRHMEDHTLGLSMAGYIPWLLWEIVKANLAVAKIVLSPSLPIRRQIVQVDAGQHGEGARVLHANSITLTPGTISLAVRHDSILVHAIDDAAAQGVIEGAINRRVGSLEKPK